MIERLLDNVDRYHPRRWALENISCIKSSEILNGIIKHSVSRGEGDWTEDIAVRSNSPDLRYYNADDTLKFSKYNESLRQFVK
jgi:hypothetical protein